MGLHITSNHLFFRTGLAASLLLPDDRHALSVCYGVRATHMAYAGIHRCSPPQSLRSESLVAIPKS